MQPLSASLEIAAGPQQARPGMSGGVPATARQNSSDNATPRSPQARGVRFCGRPGGPASPGRDAR